MNLLNLSRYFPPPKYLTMPSIGIDISDRSLKFVELVYKRGHLELGRFGAKAIPEGLIQSGEIKNKAGLIDFLKTNIKELEGSPIILALPEEKAYLGLVSLPQIPESNLREALELQLEEHVPLAPAQAIFDYELISSSTSTDHLDVVLVALPRTLVEDYSEVMSGAGLTPLVFEMEASALVRSVLPAHQDEIAMILDFGRTRTSFIIVSGGKVRFTSTVLVAGEALDQALAKALNIDIFEAERLKGERGFMMTNDNREIFDAFLPIVSAIRDEVLRYITFWSNHATHLHNQKPEIKKIYLCGGDSNLKGFAAYLSYELRLPVELANPWVNITSFRDYVPEITYSVSLSYATALGLALRAKSLNIQRHD